MHSAATPRSITGRKTGRVAALYSGCGPNTRTSALGQFRAVGRAAKSEPALSPSEIVLLADIDEPTLNRVRAEAAAQTLARELVNLPPCDLFPETFAARATALSGKFECEVWDENRLTAERMGAILGVANAAIRPARFLILRYRNGGTSPTLALVGKGVTFDSGGLSLKANDQMADMKCDMAGGAAVLASVWAAAELGLKANVLGLQSAGRKHAWRPSPQAGDVFGPGTARRSKSQNTDAEAA